MDIMGFFNQKESCPQIIIPRAPIIRSVVDEVYAELEEYEMDLETVENNTDYAENYVKQEEELCLKLASSSIIQENELFRPDTPSSIVTNINHISKKFAYDVTRKIKDNLSIFDFQKMIELTIQTNGIVVIQGPTGCGKTTQVPQFIFDMCYKDDKYCKIAVAQPRRLAAVSVAKRVSEERGWPLGSIVGYQVGLDNKTSEESIITYMTTGVLLQKLIDQKSMNQFTHIILDEIHERNQEMDFLLLLVRRFFRTVSPQVKVILMSATIDVENFASYFSVPCGMSLTTAVILDVTKRQPYSINIYYLDQFKQLLSNTILNFNHDEPKIHNELYKVVIKLLITFNKMDAQKEKNGSVLIFLPGIYEIEELYHLLKTHDKGPIKWFIVPLHSSITVEEQKRAFEIPQASYRKIILSTNIAESSITVRDVTYVIDFCLTKMLTCDTKSNYSSLKLEWASHTNCNQRSGRVGRVSSGKVYRLVPQSFYEEEMDERQIPEMLRCPMHRLILYAKILNLEIPPHGILALAMDPPNLSDIEQNISLLKEVGALLLTSQGIYSRRDGDLTYLGNIIAHLPLDIHASKLIALGYIFSCFHESIVIATATTLNIFSAPFNDRMKAYMSKLNWADGSCSDLIAYLHVYTVWERNRAGNLFGEGGETLWMKRNFLQPKIMREWRNLILEVKQRLNHLGLTEPIEGRSIYMTDNEKGLMIKVALCGAYYPNYFIRSNEGGQIDESEAVKTLGGRDPYTTVYFMGKPQNQPGCVYAQSIRMLLNECGQNMQLSFDSSSKVYVQFKRQAINKRHVSAVIPGKIPLEVYKAVKYRQLKLPTTIPCLSSQQAEKRDNLWRSQQNFEKKLTCEKVNMCTIPGLETTIVEIEICFVNNPGHFYAHNVGDDDIMSAIQYILTALNTEELKPLQEDPIVGQLCVAPFDKCYYRARIMQIIPAKKYLKILVFFIDYGNTEYVLKSDLREIPHKLPIFSPLAMECVLMGVQPSLSMNVHAMWTKQALDYFLKITNDQKIYGKVFSVVDGVVSLELFINKPNVNSINKKMIDDSYAQPAEESYLSKSDHKKRGEIHFNTNLISHSSLEVEWIDQSNEMDSPKPFECRSNFTLRGPFSPLEMQVFSLTQCSQNKTVNIDNSSVNSVLLDYDPQDPHDRLLVAASVGQNTEGTRLNLRHTTLLPNIHGFPVIMAMIFCPRMKLHVNKEGTKIISILCGNGYNSETKKSYFPAHDIVLNLDFEITNEDITTINELRYFMNMSMQSISCYKTALHPKMSIEVCQDEIKKRIRSTFNKIRKPFERIILPNAHVWSSVPKNVKAAQPDYVDDEQDIWPMHSSYILNDCIAMQLKAHLKDMHNMVKNIIPISEITCLFCKITMLSVEEMKLHLLSQNHKAKERERLKSFTRT